MSAPLEDYALIGDGRSAALIRRNGSIDWLCWPRFDSEACFAALLGHPEHGCWSITPVDPAAQITRRYEPDTVILETEFETSEGAVRLIDFMPVGTANTSIVRLVVGLRGRVAMRFSLSLRFDFGRVTPWVELRGNGFVAKVGPHLVTLRSPVAIDASHENATAEFIVSEGQRLPFVLSYGAANAPEPPAIDVERSLAETRQDSVDWIGRFDKPTDWPDAVRRSLLTLRALIHRPTGAIVAAPTTSLPEKPGGEMNWDYRFCWLRDSTFMLSALLNAGYHGEATAWRDWMLRAVAADPAKMHIMYHVDGARHLEERLIDWLPGYRWATPVRVGNAAAQQRQIDIFGEVIDAMDLITRAGIEQSEHGRYVERELAQHLETVWNLPGQGLWESRGTPRHYTYSRAMAWAGVDRFLRGARRPGRTEDSALLARLDRLRAHIHAEVCREGYNSGLGHFAHHYGGDRVDASLLMLPLIGFMPADDPRMARTIAAIERDLTDDGLLLRHAQDGPEKEGAFLACTCWLADCQRLQGRAEEARRSLERVLAVRTDLGLLSEEYDTRSRRLNGNFPQALSHIALINTALGLSGPVLQRGGG